MVRFCCKAALLLALTTVRAEQLLPIAEGTTWQYQVSEEPRGTGANASPPQVVTIRIAGKQQLDGKELLQFETYAGETVSRTELLSVDNSGIIRFGRIGAQGETVRLHPPQTIVPAPLKAGAEWDFQSEMADPKTRRHYTITGQEDVVVPAGTFRAFHLRAESRGMMSTTILRWFVPGTGFVKETMTTRGPTRELLEKVTLELKESPHVGGKPAAHSAGSQKFEVVVSDQRDGEIKTEVSSSAPNIYVRWRGENLVDGSGVRVAWIAEDVGDVAPPNFVVDETETVVSGTESAARFTLSRPQDGWAEGKYRVELYLEDVLMETVSLKILR